MTYLSEDYIGKLFKKSTGISLVTYTNRYRTAIAANLLKNTELRVKDVAIQSGMHDIYSFSKVFKKYIGMSPTEFRNQQLKT